MKQILENDRLVIQINEHGAELSRIYDKLLQREVLWDGNPVTWARHAPILFPFVGQCFHQQYSIGGQTYPTTQHGFARDMEFSLVSKSEGEVWYQLKDDEETRKKYPFAFSLSLGYQLQKDEIKVLWRVENPASDETMYFSIGGHPAFVVPEDVEGPLLLAAGDKKALLYEQPGANGFVDPKDINCLDISAPVVMNEAFYQVPTYIFHDAQVDEISLLLPDKSPYVTIYCPGFPYLGVWSPDVTKFHCLEPWFGRCDDDGYHGDFKDKTGIIALEPQGVFEADYIIKIHE